MRRLRFELLVLAFAVSPAFLPLVPPSIRPVFPHSARWCHQIVCCYRFWPSSGPFQRFPVNLYASSVLMTGVDPKSKTGHFESSGQCVSRLKLLRIQIKTKKSDGHTITCRIFFIDHSRRRRLREFGWRRYEISLKTPEIPGIHRLDCFFLRFALRLPVFIFSSAPGATALYLYRRQNVAPAEFGLFAARFTTDVRSVRCRVGSGRVSVYTFEQTPFE